MYDPEGFQVANPLNGFAIGDRDALKYNADGSLDPYVQYESPVPTRDRIGCQRRRAELSA
jgi:hypothetical protein